MPATALADPGQYAVQVESKVGGVATLTNILYFTVPPAAPDAPLNTVKPYTLDDVIADLNAVSPYDWRGLFNRRMAQLDPEPAFPGEGLRRPDRSPPPRPAPRVCAGRRAPGRR